MGIEIISIDTVVTKRFTIDCGSVYHENKELLVKFTLELKPFIMNSEIVLEYDEGLTISDIKSRVEKDIRKAIEGECIE